MGNCKYGRIGVCEKLFRPSCPDDESCYECELMTNADRIRAMSDDELAKKCLHLMGAERITASRAGGGYHVFFGPTGRVMPYGEALNAWMDWLQQPVEEKQHAARAGGGNNEIKTI